MGNDMDIQGVTWDEGWEKNRTEEESVCRAHFLFLYWSSSCLTGFGKAFAGMSASVPMSGPCTSRCHMDSFCWERGAFTKKKKNNCWEFVAVFILFSCLQSLVRVVFPAIFLSYQPYNFIVIIRCGKSFDTHPGWCLCQADCLLICLTNGFRHFLVSFCLSLLTFEIFVSKEKAQVFSFPCLLLFKCI